MNFWDMSSPGIGLVVSIPNIVLSTRFMMILWPFLSPWGTIMQSKFIEILFCFYIGKINDLTISSVYFFRNQNLYECLLMRLPAYHLPIRPIFLRLDIKRKTLIINYQCFYKSVGVTRFELATTRPPDAFIYIIIIWLLGLYLLFIYYLHGICMVIFEWKYSFSDRKKLSQYSCCFLYFLQYRPQNIVLSGSLHVIIWL